MYLNINLNLHDSQFIKNKMLKCKANRQRYCIPFFFINYRRRRDYPNRPPPEGSTYYPKFPNVNYPYGGSESPTRIFELDDVPRVR